MFGDFSFCLYSSGVQRGFARDIPRYKIQEGEGWHHGVLWSENQGVVEYVSEDGVHNGYTAATSYGCPQKPIISAYLSACKKDLAM